MENLQLSLKTKWFEMTKAGIKTEDYRDLSPFWCCRLCCYKGQHKNQNWWEDFLKDSYSNILFDFMTFKPFSSNIMTLGYPKYTDSERILILEHKGIEIRTGNPEWGAEPNKLYFVIKHGKICQ